ncbi:UTP--glucose-1-phosphate uridylyltransferase GalU [Desulforamulus hydrothermalis]|uniref:UTP--glucose-1-phosphate uridylyltransferase n=1 Tax=Desulforamulus hydrothermalis Lam5 = DSM 18033 TaxID=1121428 RepID=K8DXY2_9FIRM|nr:UTP--glucose-1-phosphate uridylyltransferase GalU [Desulforamulus hydrothermalis]CCO07612.1 putative subunit with GalU [Desulforamulus hydrothermalis Lam5 = DSM 18033]SHH19915.1 UDP-glucose pyrophosphorylase [Desulforamulus hydrothermalis Lam5 = DSM 18033]
MRVRKAIIPAAGLGVRFLPATKAQPKEMLPIVDTPTIQYIVEEAVASGIEDILIVTGRHKRAIEDHFDKSLELEMQLSSKQKHELLGLVRDISEMVDIHYIRQKEPLGLGHAVYCARKFIGDEPFAVLLGDDVIRSQVPCLKQMLNLYDDVRYTVLGVQEVPRQQVDRYGIVAAAPERQGVCRIYDLVEKPPVDQAPSQLAVMGRYILTPRIFDILAATRPGAGGEIQLTDALKKLVQAEAIYGCLFEGKRYDVGDKLGYLKATVEFALERPDLAADFRAYLKEIVNQTVKDEA